jgi:hypothetical protein
LDSRDEVAVLDDKAGPLELRGLSRRYGDVVALDGAGKTTAMRAILRAGRRLKVRQVLSARSA